MRASTFNNIKNSAMSIYSLQDDSPLFNETQRLAFWLIEELRLNDGSPERAGDLAKAISARYKKQHTAEYIRVILRALIAGGAPIESARSRGYWLSE